MTTRTAVLARAGIDASQRPYPAGRWLFAALLAVAAGIAVWSLARGDPRIAYGAAASLLAGLATAVGAAPIFTVRAIFQRAQDTMLGFGAGVMLAASAFSLIVPGIAAAEALWGSRFFAAAIAAAGIAAGALFLWAADRFWLRGNRPPSRACKLAFRNSLAAKTQRAVWKKFAALSSRLCGKQS